MDQNQTKKRNQNKPYKITNVYKSKMNTNREMTNNEYKILWTLIWFIFLGILCLHFNSGWYLLLMIIWLIGVC